MIFIMLFHLLFSNFKSDNDKILDYEHDTKNKLENNKNRI